MEKDKLSILDVWGAYGQKDIKLLDRSKINKPARGIGWAYDRKYLKPLASVWPF